MLPLPLILVGGSCWRTSFHVIGTFRRHDQHASGSARNPSFTPGLHRLGRRVIIAFLVDKKPCQFLIPTSELVQAPLDP